MSKTKQKRVEQNLCNSCEDEYINDCKLTQIVKTDTGYYIEADVIFKIGIDNYDYGWLSALINKDLSVKEIIDMGY